MRYYVLAIHGSGSATQHSVSGPFLQQAAASAAIALLGHARSAEIVSAAQAIERPERPLREMAERHPLSVRAAKVALRAAEIRAAKVALIAAAGGAT